MWLKYVGTCKMPKELLAHCKFLINVSFHFIILKVF